MPVSKNMKQSGTKNRKVQTLGGKASPQSKPADTRVGTLHDWRVGGKANGSKGTRRDPSRDGR
jgi:hypothetical protein